MDDHVDARGLGVGRAAGGQHQEGFLGQLDRRLGCCTAQAPGRVEHQASAKVGRVLRHVGAVHAVGVDEAKRARDRSRHGRGHDHLGIFQHHAGRQLLQHHHIARGDGGRAVRADGAARGRGFELGANGREVAVGGEAAELLRAQTQFLDGCHVGLLKTMISNPGPAGVPAPLGHQPRGLMILTAVSSTVTPWSVNCLESP